MATPDLRGQVAAGPPAVSRRSLFGSFLGEDPAVFLVCLSVWTLTNMDQAIFGFAIPGILAEFRLPLGGIGIILTLSFLVAAVLVIVAGVVADRVGRGLTLTVLLAASALMVGLQGFAQGVVMLTTLRALGFGLSGGLSPITNAMVVENAPSRFRGIAMGLLQCGYPLGWLLASLFAAPLLQRFGWRTTCYIAFAVIPLAAPIFYLLKRRKVYHEPTALTATPAPGVLPETSGMATLLAPEHRRASLATMAVSFMFGGAYAGSAFFFPAFFTQEHNYSAAQAASLVGLSNGIAVFGYMGAAVAGEFVITRRNVFVLWCLGGAMALLGLLWVSTGRLQDMFWFGLMAGLFFGSQAVFPALVSEIFPAQVRATALAVCVSAPLSLSFALFPLIVPIVVVAHGWPSGLSIVVVPLLLGAALTALVLPNRRSGVALDVAAP